MDIKQKFIPVSNTYARPGIKMKPKYITIHETDNTGKGADAEAHANLQYNGNSRQASWHFTVDGNEIWQSLPTNEVGWHAGNSKGNMESVAIEICVNSDGDYQKAVRMAAELTKYLMNTLMIPLGNVVQHNHWSGKHCPRHLRDGDKGLNWDSFIGLVKDKKYKVTIPNTALWQARGLVYEYEHKGFKCEGVAKKVYGPGQKAADKDPYAFVLYDLTFEQAKALVIELKVRGYSRAEGSVM